MAKKTRHPHLDIMSFHREVTGSCILCVLKLPDGRTKRFIVDCGLYQEKEYSDLNSELLYNPRKIEFALITHNHVDHVGKLPYITRKGFKGKIYATEPTCNLIEHALKDSNHVLKDIAKRNHTAPLYEKKDVKETLKLMRPCIYNRTINVDENIRVTFFNNNGHLPGAATILVQIVCKGYDNINVLFTGDYNNKNMFLKLQELPDWVRRLPLTVVQESTYGDMDSTQIVKCFEQNVIRCIKNRGTVVSPVFSLGRAQEVLYKIKCMQDEGLISTDIPIYLDGKLAVTYTQLFINGKVGIKSSMKNFLPKNFKYVDSTLREKLLHDYTPKIILATSGMGTYGPVQSYISEYISRKNAMIHFTGYTAEDTLGYKLKTAKEGDVVDIGSLFVKKQAQVEYTSEFSAHAKADELIEFLRSLWDIRLVLINHGETETQEFYANRVLREAKTHKVGLLNRTYIFRINANGLEETLPTEFM